MFGKRKASPADHLSGQPTFASQTPRLDVDGVSRVIPMGMWDGQSGDMLRSAGLSPNDPSNLSPTLEVLNARSDAAEAAQVSYIDQVNADLQKVAPGVTVAPWAMIPWSVWSGEAAPLLLVVCEMFPAEMWNRFLMPADEQSAYALSMPVHPRAGIRGVDETCTRLLLELNKEHKTAFQEANAALSNGNISALGPYGASVENAKNRVLMLAHAITADVFGQDVFDRHKQLFGETLGWVNKK